MMPHSHSMHGCGCLPRPPIRHCRQEAKELLVRDDKQRSTTVNAAGLDAAASAGQDIGNTGDDIIGGGCCVTLSVEYMPANASLQDQVCNVLVEVVDSQGSTLGWRKQFKEGYHVKECIITTNPGAKLHVVVSNAIARVRWCEVFSC